MFQVHRFLYFRNISPTRINKEYIAGFGDSGRSQPARNSTGTSLDWLRPSPGSRPIDFPSHSPARGCRRENTEVSCAFREVRFPGAADPAFVRQMRLHCSITAAEISKVPGSGNGACSVDHSGCVAETWADAVPALNRNAREVARSGHAHRQRASAAPARPFTPLRLPGAVLVHRWFGAAPGTPVHSEILGA